MYGLSQAIRLLSNIILARLLVPEYFGIMLIVQMFIEGLHMISDLGLGQSIVRSSRGEEPRFVRTAWTIHVVRGMLLWLLVVSISYPVARFYEEPALTLVLSVTGFSVCIDGLKSMNLALLTRHLKVRARLSIEIASQIVATVSMIVLAYFWRNVWALVLGTLISSATRVVISHCIKGQKMGFEINREVVGELFHFGKWIFLSTIFTFAFTRGDSLTLGKFMPVAELGVYSFALRFARILPDVTAQISSSILFPVYARAAEASVHEIRRQTIRARAIVMGTAVPPICVLAIFGQYIIDFLFPDRYAAAGGMLEVLIFGALGMVVIGPVGSVLLAVGNSFRHMLLELTRMLAVIACLVIGGTLYGVEGILWGIVAGAYVYYPVLVLLVRRYNVWLPLVDFGVLAAALGVIFGGRWLLGHFMG